MIDWSKRSVQNIDNMMSTAKEGSFLADSWNDLTNDEKQLVVVYPKEALMVHADQQATDELVRAIYSWHRDGSEANAYRHAVWNALMARDIGQSLAEAFATAHEAVGESTLMQTWNHHLGFEHRTMDLYNNNLGRSVVNWNDWFASDSALAERVMIKKSSWYILVYTINCSDCY